MKCRGNIVFYVFVSLILFVEIVAGDHVFEDFYGSYVTGENGPWGFADRNCWAYERELNFLIYIFSLLLLQVMFVGVGIMNIKKRKFVAVLCFLIPVVVILCNYYSLNAGEIVYCKCRSWL